MISYIVVSIHILGVMYFMYIMVNFMENRISIFFYYILVIFIFSSCFPSFSPQKKLIKRIETDKAKIEWYGYIGILDQNFPDLVIFSNKSINDTICRGFNIAEVNIINNNILIGFYGKQNIRNDMALKIDGYNIIIDTTFLQIDKDHAFRN